MFLCSGKLDLFELYEIVMSAISRKLSGDKNLHLFHTTVKFLFFTYVNQLNTWQGVSLHQYASNNDRFSIILGIHYPRVVPDHR